MRTRHFLYLNILKLVTISISPSISNSTTILASKSVRSLVICDNYLNLDCESNENYISIDKN